MALNNADVLRLKNRITALNTRVNNFYNSLNGQDPNANQERVIQEEAIQASNQFLEVARIIEIGQQQVKLQAELDEYRG